MYHEYLTDARVMICPSDLPNAPLLKKQGLELMDDHSYFYLGYAMMNIEDLEAFADAYTDRIAKELPFDTDLDTPRGKLYRLRVGVERFFVTDLNNPGESAMKQSMIPIIIEPPSHHDPMGGNILYLDGHVEFRRYIDNGEFPMNKRSMDILRDLSRMKGASAH